MQNYGPQHMQNYHTAFGPETQMMIPLDYQWLLQVS